jgi:hypothetical protein
LKAQLDIFLLSKVLGHSEARTTKLYSHVLPDHLARARNAVELRAGSRRCRARSEPTMGSKRICRSDAPRRRVERQNDRRARSKPWLAPWLATLVDFGRFCFP